MNRSSLGETSGEASEADGTACVKALWQEAAWYFRVVKAETASVGTRCWRDGMRPDPTSVLEFVVKVLISVLRAMSNYGRVLAGRKHAQIYVF